MRARIIAFYLPQFHPTADNDKWWGKGFTEWTNVGKAKPLFRGHYQPRVPADLGYYDLRVPEVRKQQADLAKEAGIEGFCYYHYWFGNNKRELELPFNEVLTSGKPDFPFCLCWANESWNAKFWNNDGSFNKTTLIAQDYGGEEDYIKHFETLLPAFKDDRYIRVHNKPLFMIYRPLDFGDVASFIALWQQLAKSNGLEGIYFVGQTVDVAEEKAKILAKGFDAINVVRLWEYGRKRELYKKIYTKIMRTITHRPFVYPYRKAITRFVGEEEKKEDVFPTLIPNWDHTPRSGYGGYVLHGATPLLFSKHIQKVMETVSHKPLESNIVFLKSWNEWGEGNYMEPDLKFGRGFLQALKETIKE